MLIRREYRRPQAQQAGASAVPPQFMHRVTRDLMTPRPILRLTPALAEELDQASMSRVLYGHTGLDDDSLIFRKIIDESFNVNSNMTNEEINHIFRFSNRVAHLFQDRVYRRISPAYTVAFQDLLDFYERLPVEGHSDRVISWLKTNLELGYNHATQNLDENVPGRRYADRQEMENYPPRLR